MFQINRTTIPDHSSTSENYINHLTAPHADAAKVKRLEFLAKDLDHDINLLLVFDVPKSAGSVFVDFFPVCWKIVSFTASGTSLAEVTFTGRTAFIVPQVNGHIVAAANAQACELGQQCTLKINAKGIEYLTEAEIGTPGIMKCINETGAPANISIGFYNEAGTKAEPVFVWKHIDKESNLSVHPTSKLQIYAVSDYQATEMITGKINSDIIWERDLYDLAPSTEWNLCYEKNTKKYTIEEVFM